MLGKSSHDLLYEVPMSEQWRRLRSRLRERDLQQPIQKTRDLMDSKKREKVQKDEGNQLHDRRSSDGKGLDIDPGNCSWIP